MITEQVKAPIFFIGVPRSGTTIIFEAFSNHENLAWFSNWLARYPNFPAVSLLSRITFSHTLRGAKRQSLKQSRLRNFFPYPSECYPVWMACCGSRFLFEFLFNEVAGNSEKRKTIRLISQVMHYHGKRRFATKITGPSKIHYLNSIFPDAKFIHIIRDGRAVVNSLMNVKFWKEGGGYTGTWWNKGLTSKDIEIYERYEKSPLALAAIQWRRIILIAKDEAVKISSDQYYELKYEDFMNGPYEFMAKMFNFSGLKHSQKVLGYMNKKSQFKSQNYKYLESMSIKNIKMLNDIMGDLLTDLGYFIA